VVGPVLSAIGPAMIVFGVLKGGEWGFVQLKPSAPTWLGLSPSTWLILGGGAIVAVFFSANIGSSIAVLNRRSIRPCSAIGLYRAGSSPSSSSTCSRLACSLPCRCSYQSPSGCPAIATGVRLQSLSITLLIAGTSDSDKTDE
jgi:hypothetical protein